MSRQNEIIVFAPNSKKTDFRFKHVFIEQGVEHVKRELGCEEATKVRSAFRTLKRLGGESMVFRHGGRKIKVQLAA